jgi:hypothetical protein
LATHPLLELPAHGGRVDAAHVAGALGRYLTKTPLTDLATCARAEPAFVWTREALALAGAPFGRALAVRATARADAHGADQALGRATRALFATKALVAMGVAATVLAERLLMEALAAAPPKSVPAGDAAGDVAFARAVGAVVAKDWVTRGAIPMRAEDRRRVLSVLDGPARSPQAKAAREAIAAAAAGAAIAEP